MTVRPAKLLGLQESILRRRDSIHRPVVAEDAALQPVSAPLDLDQGIGFSVTKHARVPGGDMRPNLPSIRSLRRRDAELAVRQIRRGNQPSDPNLQNHGWMANVSGGLEAYEMTRTEAQTGTLAVSDGLDLRVASSHGQREETHRAKITYGGRSCSRPRHVSLRSRCWQRFWL